MPVRINCPKCKISLVVAEDSIDRTYRCSQCETIFRVAANSPAPPSPSASAPATLPKSPATSPGGKLAPEASSTVPAAQLKRSLPSRKAAAAIPSKNKAAAPEVPAPTRKGLSCLAVAAVAFVCFVTGSFFGGGVGYFLSSLTAKVAPAVDGKIAQVAEKDQALQSGGTPVSGPAHSSVSSEPAPKANPPAADSAPEESSVQAALPPPQPDVKPDPLAKLRSALEKGSLPPPQPAVKPDPPRPEPATAADKDAAKKVLKKLEGNWQMVSGDGDAENKRLIIEDGVASQYFGNNRQQASKLRVDPNANPKTIDFIEGDNVSLGIYRLSEDGNELEICRGEWGGKKRPTKFSTKPGVGSGRFLHGFKREKDGDAPSSKPATVADNDAAKKVLKKLEGNWQMVSGDDLAGKKRLIIEDGVASQYFGNNRQQASKLRVDPNANPKTIDFIEGDKVSLGIYRLSEDGNELEICSAGWGGKKRPTKFSTKPGVGSGNFLNVFKREKE